MASSASHVPIRTPVRRRFRIWRQRFLPFTVWVGAIALLIVLAGYQQSRTSVIPGVVEQNEVTVSPPVEGLVGGIAVDVYDNVTNGQIVAMMDDTLIRGELLVAQAELAELRARLTDMERQVAEARSEQATELRRFSLDYEQAKLERLDRWVDQESDRVSLRRLERLADRQRAMVEEGVFDELTYEQTELESESLRRRVEESEAVLAEARKQIELAAERLAEYETTVENIEEDTAVAPIAKAIDVQEAVIKSISERMSKLVLRAPISGRVARIFYSPGETITVGAPLMTIVDHRPRRVTAYVDEGTAKQLAVGDELQVFAQSSPEQVVAARVLKIAQQIEPYPLDASGQTHEMTVRNGQRVERFPQYLRAGTMQLKWGRPVLLGEFPEGIFVPGQPVMVRYTPASRLPLLDSML